MAQYLATLKRKQLVILGLGLSGLSCARFLAKYGLTATVMDSRANPAGADWLHEHVPSWPKYFGEVNQSILYQADVIIISPGLSLAMAEVQAAIAAGVEVIGDVELFARLNNKPVIGITGSNGKSTVTSLVEYLLRAAGINAMAAGNIGLPVLDALSAQPDVFVLELSSFQLETTSSLAMVSATILNVTPDHLDRHGDMHGYAAAKQRIYQHCQLAVSNADDRATWLLEPAEHQQHVQFSVQSHAVPYHYADGLLQLAGGEQIAATQLPIAGLHNIANVLAAMALIRPLVTDLTPVIAALPQFNGLAHRCQLVHQANGVRFIDDSKATNIGATIAALAGLAHEAPIVLLAGGDAKGADLTELAPYIQPLKALVTIGRDGPAIAALRGDAVQCPSLHAAVAAAWQLASPGDIVLLSPACASLDMFSSYAERGQLFAQFAHEVSKDETT